VLTGRRGEGGNCIPARRTATWAVDKHNGPGQLRYPVGAPWTAGSSAAEEELGDGAVTAALAARSRPARNMEIMLIYGAAIASGRHDVP